jgi:hypothetical protein
MCVLTIVAGSTAQIVEESGVANDEAFKGFYQRHGTSS